MNVYPVDFVIAPLVVLAVVAALVAITWLAGAVIVARAKAAADRLAVDGLDDDALYAVRRQLGDLRQCAEALGVGL